MKSSLPTILGSVPLIPDGFIQKQVYIHNCIDQQLPDEQRTRNGFSIVCQNCTHRRSRNHDDTPEYVCNCTRGIQWSRDQRGIESWTAYLIELRNCGMPPFSPSPIQLFSVMVWYKPGRVAEIFCSAIYPRAFFLGGVFFFARFFGWSWGPGNPSTDTSHNAHQSPKPPLHAWQHKVLLQPRRKINKTPMTTSRTFFRSYFVAHNKAANKLSNVTNYQNLMWIQFILMLYFF